MICRHQINLLISYQKYIKIASNRNIYLSPLNFVRKPSSARRVLNSAFEDIQERNVAGVFSEAPKKINLFKNFYGIEGDEGVINVDESEKYKKSIQGLKKITFTPEDEYRSYNFGAVRLDNENRPSYSPRRIAKPNKKDEVELNNQEKNAVQSKDLDVHNRKSVLNSFEPVNLNQNIPENLFDYDKHEQVVSVGNKRNQSVSPMSEANIQSFNEGTIDSLTSSNFSADSYNQNQFANQDSSEVSESIIDKDYFNEYYAGNVVPCSESSSSSLNNKNQNIPNNSLNYGEYEQVSHRKNINVSSNVMNSLSKSNSYSTDRDASEFSDQNNFSKQNSPNVSESLIDKDYFDKYYTENPISQTKESSNNFIEDQFFKKSSLNVSESECNTASINEAKENYFPESLADDFVQVSEEPKLGEKIVYETCNDEKKVFPHESEIDFNQYIDVQDITIGIKDFSSKKVPTMPHGENEHNSFSQKSDRFKSYGKTSTTRTDLTKGSEKNSQVFLEAENDNTISSEKTFNSPDNSDEIKIETAFDFVKQLRQKNKLLSDEVKKGISTKKEKKVDSKGFRILKHQVPSLQYFTRDEMLELLKGSVLYSDEDIVVLNKPYNLVIHESTTTQDLACLSRYLDDFAKLLDQQTNSPKLFTVHRLDKETTGCLLLARNEVSAARLKSLFAQRKIVKTYWIVTTKVPDPMEGIIDIPISEGTIEKRSRMVLHPKLPDDVPYVSHSKPGKQAITQYSVIAVSGNAALVEVKPETGIKHQIRVHFGFGLGCPILGDHKYSHIDKLVPQKLSSDLLQKLQVRQSKVRHIPLHIHSKHVLIPQYSNDRNLFVTAPLPRHMSENLRFLKFKKK